MNGSTSNFGCSKPETFELVVVRNGVFALREWRNQILVFIEVLELVQVHAANIAELANKMIKRVFTLLQIEVLLDAVSCSNTHFFQAVAISINYFFY